MKIDAFYFRWLNGVFALFCTKCKRSFSQTLQVIFDARPGGEWEVSGRCKGCGADWSKLVKASQIVGVPGNKTIAQFNKDFTEGMKKWMNW